MALMVWEVVKEIRCCRTAQAAQLLEERVYCEDPMPDVGWPYTARAHKCSAGTKCNLAGYACRWAYTNPSYDPFTEA